MIIPFKIDGEEHEFINDFLNPEDLIQENKSLVPGCAVFKEGYLCIGVESEIGNPYAININEGNNPPVYLLDHEYGEDTEKIINNHGIVVEKLSDLLSAGTIGEAGY